MQNDTLPNQGTSTPGTTVTEILPQLAPGQQRTSLVITNTSTSGQTITVGYGLNAVAGQGIVLYPGGSISEAWDGSFLPSNERITVLGSAASASVAYQERHA